MLPKNYDAFFEASPLPFALVEYTRALNGIAGNFLFSSVNKAFSEMTGILNENISGKSVSAFFPSLNTSSAAYQNLLRTISAESGHFHFTYTNPLKNRFYNATLYPSGEGFCSIIFNEEPDTAHKAEAEAQYKEAIEQAKQKIEESERKYKLIAENTSDGIIVFDAESNIRYVSPAYLRQLGYSEQEELERNAGKIYAMLHPDDRDDLFARIFKAIEQKKTDLLYTYRVRHINGHYIWREDNAKFNYAPDGTYLGAYVICRNITDRKELHQQLLHQTAFKELLLDVSSNFINVPIEYTDDLINKSIEKIGRFINADKSVIFEIDSTNYTARGIYEWCGEGITPDIDKLRNIPIKETLSLIEECDKGVLIYEEEAGENYNSPVQKSLDLEGIKNIVTVPMRSDDRYLGFVEFYFINQHHSYAEPEIQLLKLFSRLLADLFSKKIVMQQLVSAKDKAEEMNRIKSNFFANMSHELRTPMIGILGYSEILMDKDDEAVQRFAGVINRAGRRLLDTLNLILNMSSIEAGKISYSKSVVNATAVMAEAVTTFKEAALRKKLTIASLTEYSPLYIETDSRILQQVLNNLLNNAIKYTDEGGVILSLRIVSNGNEEAVEFSVKDTGIGIDEADHSLIFEEFRQVSEGTGRSFEGTGLGLSITRNFVKILGGNIRVESSLGKGACFIFSLPYTPGLKPAETEDLAPSATTTTNSTQVEEFPLSSVLLVEDDSAAAALVKMLLKDICIVECACNSEEALEKVKSVQYPLILMDINLGRGADGIDTTKRIRTLPGYLHTPILALTAYAREEDKQEFLASGCTDYISKPFNFAEFKSKVKLLITES